MAAGVLRICHATGLLCRFRHTRGKRVHERCIVRYFLCDMVYQYAILVSPVLATFYKWFKQSNRNCAQHVFVPRVFVLGLTPPAPPAPTPPYTPDADPTCSRASGTLGAGFARF